MSHELYKLLCHKITCVHCTLCPHLQSDLYMLDDVAGFLLNLLGSTDEGVHFGDFNRTVFFLICHKGSYGLSSSSTVFQIFTPRCIDMQETQL